MNSLRDNLAPELLEFHTKVMTGHFSKAMSGVNLPRSPLRNFVNKKGEIYETYEDFHVSQISQLPLWKKPWLNLSNDIDRAIEKYYEEINCLPIGYLRGLWYYKPLGSSFKRFVRILVKDYERQLAAAAVSIAATAITEVYIKTLFDTNKPIASSLTD